MAEQTTIKCTPPKSLLNYDSPLYVGMSLLDNVSNAKKAATNGQGGTQGEQLGTQLDDMLNSMLPPR